MTKKRGGLEGVVASTSSITVVDGERGTLAYRGIDIHELATRSTFEETAHLLWYGRLPIQSELDDLKRKLYSSRDIPEDLTRMIVESMPSWDSMESLRTGVSALSGYDPGGTNHNLREDQDRAIALTARMPVIVAAYHRARQKRQLIPPRRDLSAAANFLYMLTGEVPKEEHAHFLDVALIVHADHEFNASTFAARVAASTLADIYSAVTAAIGTLDGPLHGGANERVMEMLEKIGEPARAEQYVLNLLAQGKRVMGFGHRVYKTEDPRGEELRGIAARLGRETGETRWWAISQRIEEVMKREKGLNFNLDFISAQVYHGLGIPTDLMTPVFACSRIVGWTAHILEQYQDNRLIRPRAEYTGPRNVPYVPIDQRVHEAAA